MPQTLEAIDHARAAQGARSSSRSTRSTRPTPTRIASRPSCPSTASSSRSTAATCRWCRSSAKSRPGHRRPARDDPDRVRRPGARRPTPSGRPSARSSRRSWTRAAARSRPCSSRRARSKSATSSSSATPTAAFARWRTAAASASRRPDQPAPSSPGSGRGPRRGRHPARAADEKTARAMVEERRATVAAKRRRAAGRATLEDLYRQIQAGQTKELRIILKADVQGSLGAIRHALEQVQTDEVRINVLHEGTGDITDNDILLASASDAVVVGFNTKLDRNGASHGGGRGRRGPPVRHHLPAHRRDGRGPQAACSSRKTSRSSRAAPRSARSSGSARTR